MIRIGTAGWSLPTEWQDEFPEGESHLHRYGQVLSAVEINRTFKEMPQASTFARWADSVPEDFRFSVKVSREITHERELSDVGGLLADFLEPVRELGDRLGPLLVQLPPSLEFDADLAEAFLDELRRRRDGPDALEARHESWLTDEVDELLDDYRIGRVAADPAEGEGGDVPGGAPDLAYFRLHGQPDMYYSAYRDDGLDGWAERVEDAAETDGTDEVWCIFDNTAAGEGIPDALELREMLPSGG